MSIFLILSFSATFATPRVFWFWSLYILKRSTDRSRKSWKTPILFLAQHRYSWWLSWSESKCTRSCKCCWNESKRKIAAKSFLKRDRWRILSWHDVYLSKLTSKNGAPHRKCSCYKSLQWNAHLLQPFRVLIQACIDPTSIDLFWKLNCCQSAIFRLQWTRGQTLTFSPYVGEYIFSYIRWNYPKWENFSRLLENAQPAELNSIQLTRLNCEMNRAWRNWRAQAQAKVQVQFSRISLLLLRSTRRRWILEII